MGEDSEFTLKLDGPANATPSQAPEDPSSSQSAPGPAPKRPRGRLAPLAIFVAIVVVGSVVSYEAYESYKTTPSVNPCAGIATGPSSAVDQGSFASSRTLAPFEGGAGPQPSATNSAPFQPPYPWLTNGSGPVINVVAAENFWGSLVSQLGGNQTSVLSIITDPNADPHEYEANASDAAAITAAQFVIVNGVGYDDWAIQMIAADDNPNQVVLNVGTMTGANVNGNIVTGNPHQWYNPVYVNETLGWMYSDLVGIQPASKAYFQQNWYLMNTTGELGGVSLNALYGRAHWIRNQFAGTEVASTESIFVYLANYTGLDLVSPPSFMEAIAEGNDPPAQSVVQFECQLESGNVKVLVYNVQTVTPITTQMKAIAAENNVTTMFVSETIQPPGVPFQTWMYGEYLSLQNALNANELGM